MPLPIGHSLMSYALYETISKEKLRPSWRMLLLFILVANLADFDFIPGFLLGEPHKFHRLFISHSLGGSVLVGFVFAVCVWISKKEKFVFYFLIFTGVYFSHVLLDLFNSDYSAPYGVPLFWPFSNEYVMSPVPIFMPIEKSGHGVEFIKSLFIKHNILAALWEAIVFILILTIIKLVKNRKIFFRFSF